MIFLKWYSLFFLGNLLALRVAGDGGSLLRLAGSRRHPSHSQSLNFNPQNLRSFSIPSLSSSLSPLTRTCLLSIRGGGRRKNICSSSKRKGNQSSTKNKHKKQKASSLLLPETNYNSNNSNNNNQEDTPLLPTVKAVLLPRRLSLSVVIQYVSIVAVLLALSFCIDTSGIPYARAVHTLLLSTCPGGGGGNGVDATTKVSVFDSFLARRIAVSTNDILPPRYLPATVPLLGLLGSLGICVGMTLLFPRWFVPLEVLYNYQRWEVPATATAAEQKMLSMALSSTRRSPKNKTVGSKAKSKANNNTNSNTGANAASDDTNTGASVLVEVPRAVRDFESDGKPIVVRPLYRSPERLSSSSAAARYGRMEDNGNNDNEEEDVVIACHAHPRPYFFELNHRRIYCDPFSFPTTTNQRSSSSSTVDGSPTLHTRAPLRTLLSAAVTSGLSTPSRLAIATQRFGPYASLTLPTPTVLSAFFDRISSPLVSLQILGRLLNALEENVMSSLFNLLSTLAHHYYNARRSITSAGELVSEVKGNVEDDAAMKVWALRPTTKELKATTKKKNKTRSLTTSEWIEISAEGLLPGDVFVIRLLSGQSQDLVMPVDALLMEGGCIANEAVLTGESVPQSKIPIDIDLNGKAAADSLDMMTQHRNNILFAGTSLIHCTDHANGSGDEWNHPPFPEELSPADGGASSGGAAKFLALRTGSYSSRGELMRALARSGGRAGAISNAQTEKDAMRLIASLSLFALVACASLFVTLPFTRNGGSGTTSTHHRKQASPFRRVIQCTRIVVASIPSDIPLALSSVAHSCSMKLRQDADVVCSEPGSLLTSAYVDVVVLDKTGTLTADTQSLSSIVPPPRVEGYAKYHDMTDVVLAGCHSLISLDNNKGGQRLVGDPLDLASLKHTGWDYDAVTDCYTRGTTESAKKSTIALPKRLWQLKTFPFDPNRRMSSAIILVLHNDGICRLWKVVKGSSDIMQTGVTTEHGDDENFDKWFTKKNQKLGADGLRTIALATKDMTDDLSFVDELFSKGLPTGEEINLDEIISEARHNLRHVHRDEIEPFGEWKIRMKALDFVGFACFDAALRPSTLRVVNEIKRAEIKVMMLTGDGIDAAIAVGRKAGLVRSDRITSLELQGSGDSSTLVWKVMTLPSKKKMKRGYGNMKKTIVPFTSETLRRTLSQVASNDCTLVATGNAVEMILSAKHSSHKKLQKALSQVSIVARASPKVKKSVVVCLRETCEKKVLMCGDGVNDVAAMKAADAAVALLNGYGDESITAGIDQDIEDDRRKQKLKQRKIGKNRPGLNAAKPKDKLIDAGIGDSPAASQARVKSKIDKAVIEIHQTAAARGQGGQPPSLNLNDTKNIVKAVLRAYKEERDRTKKLRKGGGEAARILSDEDKLRKVALEKKGNSSDGAFELESDEGASSDIKPGEACLAAPFSCLRPAIDGVDALLRAGVATAACSLAMQQTIALNSLMSCYNLATLYRDGFRYGNKMWNVELFLFMAIDNASYAASCTPRPRLPIARPPESIFDPSSALSILTQAGIHLMTLSAGATFANELEDSYDVSTPAIPKIRWKTREGASSKHGTLMELLAASLSGRSSEEPEEDKNSVFNIFGRPPFRPNYNTNMVFLLSILQNAVTTIVNHKGKPYCGSIVESRQMCMAVGACLLFVGACIFETFPMLNDILELRRLPSSANRLRMFALFALDFAGCFAADRLCSLFRDLQNSDGRVDGDVVDEPAVVGQTAADEEEELLAVESRENRIFLCGALICNVLFIAQSQRMA